MGIRSLIALLSVVSMWSFAGCSRDPQKVAPGTPGKRGENCQARNDCEDGLACLNGICAKNEFSIAVTAKQCDRVECESDADCCGDRATEVPEKCKGRDAKCDPAQRNIPGCIATQCTSDAVCNGGSCPMGVCQGNLQPIGQACSDAAECTQDTCVAGFCALTGTACTVATQATDCSLYNFPPTCSARACNCINPEYDPADPICTDPDCEDVCLLRCSESSLCIEDKSCKVDVDCIAVGLSTCDEGRCVECSVDADCDEKNDETCERGFCKKPCTENEECGLFEACSKGDCVYVGCQSDRECVLAASRGAGEPVDGQAAPLVRNADDPRLFKCLPSEDGGDIKVCKVPCENDGSCADFNVCDEGYCKFVGCESNDDCRAYLGIANQQTSETKPYVAKALCR